LAEAFFTAALFLGAAFLAGVFFVATEPRKSSESGILQGLGR
jgi:hypothetical protein